MALDDFQECADQRRVSGVLLTCHRVRNHAGPHASGTYGTRWRDSGEVVPPPGPRAARHKVCDEDSCTLWPDHAGPHGEQAALL